MNGQWQSMTAFFGMCNYFMATIFSDPRQFYILTTISACMVLLALLTYSYNNPEIDMGTVRSYLGYLIPDYIALSLSDEQKWYGH